MSSPSREEDRMELGRRALLGGTIGLGALSAIDAPAAPGGEMDAAWLQSAIERYAGFGNKASGGSGDEACGAWLEEELGRFGYRCERQSFDIPYFEASQATLVCGDARAAVLPQAVVVPTGSGGVSAPLRLAESGTDLTGALALLRLP